MKNVMTMLALSIVLVVPSGAQQKKSDLEQAGLLGNVKTVKVEEAKFAAKDGKKVEGKKTQVETQNYSDKGILTKSIRFDGGALTNHFYSYESNGSRLELIRSATADSRIKSEFKYDSSGNRSEEVQTNDEGLVNKVLFVFDTNGRPAEKRIFNRNGLFARRTYAYGTGANPTEEAEYDAKGALAGKQSYSYELDSTGNWVKRITSIVGTSNGKAYSEPAGVTDRTITYY